MKKIPKVFYADRRSAGKSADPLILRQAGRLLRRVAHDLKLRASEHEIVERPARKSFSCSVTLRAPGLLVEVGPARVGGDVAVAFRTRRNRQDLAGGRANVVSLEQFTTPDGYASLLTDLRAANQTKA